jgi:hypothetical protein
MRDHEDEITLLKEYLAEGVDLEKRVREVAELVKRDFEAGSEGEDIPM